MKQKTRVAILCGGRSAEHEVSIRSARNIMAALDPNKYEATLIHIDKQGRWQLGNATQLLAASESPKMAVTYQSSHELALLPGKDSELFFNQEKHPSLQNIDVVFPVLHGPYGEDGSVQGLLKLADIPCVGSGILGSAIGMDKDVMKRLLRDAGFSVAKFLVYHRYQAKTIHFDDVVAHVGLPCFVKPANLGSSVGIHKVRNKEEFIHAIADAFRYDHKIIIEEFIAGREFECALLGNDKPIASLPCEVIPHGEFYSYTAKYIDQDGATFVVPANISPAIVKNIQDIAINAFHVLECDGMARVDLFMRGKDEIIINEINTIPGFTSMSMYPQMWLASGMTYPDLVDQLIQLAIEKFSRSKELKTDYAE